MIFNQFNTLNKLNELKARIELILPCKYKIMNMTERTTKHLMIIIFP